MKSELAGGKFPIPATSENLYNPARYGRKYISGHTSKRYIGKLIKTGEKEMKSYKGLAIYRYLREVYFKICQRILRIKIKKKYGKVMKDNHYIYELGNDAKTKFYLPYFDRDLIQMHIVAEHKFYEESGLNQILNQWNDGCIGKRVKNEAVLDIGSNIGNHTLYFQMEIDAKHTYAFEPVLDTFSILEKNIAINNLHDKVDLFNVGVGEKSSKANIKSYTKSNTGSTMLETSDDGKIEIVSIDELNIDAKIGLIKIDVEGFEVGVIRGLTKTIQKNFPYIMIEIQDENFETVNSILKKYNYKFDKRSTYNYLYYHII